MNLQTILVDVRERVAVVTLNRPEVRNAIDDRMAWEWEATVRELNADPTVGAIVMTGAGIAFCAGADVSRFERAIARSERGQTDAGRRSDQAPAGEHGAGPPYEWIDLLRNGIPTVAAINGPSIGAGMTRILACDARIASTEAMFSMRFVRMGLVPELGSTQILPHLVGLPVATDLMLSGRTMGAAEALQVGLVQQVVDQDQLLDAAIALATSWSDNPPEAVRATKQLLHRNHLEPDLDVVCTSEVQAMERRWGSPENREAVAAFRERRQPSWPTTAP